MHHLVVAKRQDEILADLKIERAKLRKEKSIEVGNIFKYGTRYTKDLGVTYKDETGAEQPVVFGAYGIGLGRLMGTIVELMADEKGIVWPESVAPFAYHLVSLGQVGDDVSKKADELYADMQKKGISVLYDDRDLRAGEKFAGSDLIGIPWRIVVGRDGVKNGEYEVVDRKTGEIKKLSEHEVLAL